MIAKRWNMKEIVRQMIELFQMDNIDWLGYELQEGDIFNFHHIINRSRGGLEIIDNGSILCNSSSHQYLHIIEYKDFDMYLYLSNILLSINNQRTMPNKQQQLAIESLLQQFEREHCSDTNAKGKPLIREKYIQRINRK